MKEPKQWECLECGFKSKKTKIIKLSGLGFARCFKCGGRVKEREEWLTSLREEQRKFYSK